MKKLYCLILILLGVILGLYLRDLLPQKPAAAKIITVRSRNLEFQVETRAETMEEFLDEQGFYNPSPPPLTLRGGEREGSSLAVPPLILRGREGELLTHGAEIHVQRPVKVILVDGGSEEEIQTTAATVNDLLWEQKIGLAETDRVSAFISTPSQSPPYHGGEREGVFLAEGMIINIDRIVDLEITETNEIVYEIKLAHDPETFYGREEIITPGILGKKEQLFLITYKNGVEVRRKLLSQKVLQNPVTEIRKFGTKIEIEEVREGRASWYAYKKCLCAAHPFYDKGRYVRVTNLNSGQSIIVKINDRGPELAVHPERIIDLDSVAYKELALLGSGTIPVMVELLSN